MSGRPHDTAARPRVARGRKRRSNDDDGASVGDATLVCPGIVVASRPGAEGAQEWLRRCQRVAGPQCRITGVLNLCYTEKYYCARDLHVPCLHVPLSHDQPPTPAQLRRCLHFLASRTHLPRWTPHKASTVIVHCTHGAHRSGAVVVAYMMLVLSWPRRAAIDRFHSVRGHRGSIADRPRLWRFVTTL